MEGWYNHPHWRYHRKSIFEVNRPLLSRLRLITLEALTPKAIGQILRRAITDEEVGLGKRHLQVTDEVLEDVGIFVNGDGRMALNILEQAAAMVPDEGTISIEVLEKVVGRRIYTYDKKVIAIMIRFLRLLKVCAVRCASNSSLSSAHD